LQYRLYNFVCWVLFIVAAPLYLMYGLLTGKYLDDMKERFGFFSFLEETAFSPNRLWFHAASVGEVQVAKSIITETIKLIPNASFFLSTVTEQGKFLAKEQLGKNVLCAYAPVDLPWVVKRFIRTLQPTAYVCLETELWPNMLKTAAQNGVPVLLLNGRMSESSFKRYCYFPKFFRKVLNYFSVISCITDQDRDRFEALGVPPETLRVNGNAKYNYKVQTSAGSRSDTENDRETDHQHILSHETEEHYRKKLAVTNRDTTFVAGSTHDGEEQQLIRVYKKIREAIPGFIMLIAPRHISRIKKIESLFKKNDLEYQLYSDVCVGRRDKDIILVDTIGELAGLYSIATYIFCGGSLVPKGGHNIMEPASWGKPILYGPNMDDFKDAQDLLESAQAGLLVKNSQDICERILYFHKNQTEYLEASKKALQVAVEQHDSAKRQARIIEEILNKN